MKNIKAENFTSWSDLWNAGVANSEVYKNIRYFMIGGETYFFNEHDVECKHSFYRLLHFRTESEIEAWISDNLVFLQKLNEKTVIGNLERRLEAIGQEKEALNMEATEIYILLSKIYEKRVDQVETFFGN